MERADMADHPLHLLWKQAFDSLDHAAMTEERFGASHKMLSNIMTTYGSPTFPTKGVIGRTAKGKVSSRSSSGLPVEFRLLYDGTQQPLFMISTRTS